MYVIDVGHFLNEKGAIEPKKGPAKKLAVFTTEVIAHASNFERPDNTPGPACFKCRQRDDHRVNTGITVDDRVAWHCPVCGTEGYISNWQGTFWDLSLAPPA